MGCRCEIICRAERLAKDEGLSRRAVTCPTLECVGCDGSWCQFVSSLDDETDLAVTSEDLSQQAELDKLKAKSQLDRFYKRLEKWWALNSANF